MKETNVVAFRNPADFQEDPLTEVLRTGARRLLAEAVEAEVDAFVEAHRACVDEAGHRRVVRNGYLPERTIQTGIGPVRACASHVCGTVGTAASGSRRISCRPI